MSRDGVGADAQNCGLCPHRDHCGLYELLHRSGIQRRARVGLLEFPAGATIPTETGHIYAVRSGALKVLWTDGRERSHVLDFCFPGQLLGLESSLGLEVRWRRLVALQWTRVCFLACIDAAGSGAEVGIPSGLLVARLAGNIMPVWARTRSMLASASARVAAYLVRMLDEAAEGGGHLPALLPPVSRVDIADYLGLRSESVSRALATFRTAGWIRGTIENLEVICPEPLRELAASADRAGGHAQRKQQRKHEHSEAQG